MLLLSLTTVFIVQLLVVNNVNKIIKIRSTLDLRNVVFSNRVHILFVAYISFNKHFSKNTT